MGYRLHVCKTYRVEYSDKTGFNWKKEELLDLLRNFDCECSGIGEYDENDTFEVSADQFLSALLLMKKFSETIKAWEAEPLNNLSEDDADTLECFTKAYGRDRFIEEDISFTEAVDSVRKELYDFYNEADAHDGWLHFCFF